MKKYFVLLVFILPSVTIFSTVADVLCDVTYHSTPVCGAAGELFPGGTLRGTLQEGKSQPKMTYRTLLLDGDGTGAYSDLTLTESKVIGLGSSFTEAWNDAHDVCKWAGCTVQSCDLATEENVGSNARVEAATIKRKNISLAFKCICSYGIGGKWKEGNNSCGSFVDTGGKDELKNSVGLGWYVDSSVSESEPVRTASSDNNLSFYLNQSQELCSESLKKMENVPSNAVAFIHSCWFVFPR